MDQLFQALRDVFVGIHWDRLLLGLLILAIGQVITRLIELGYNQLVKEVSNRQKRFIWKKVIVYSLNIIFLILFLKTIGVTLKVILGAAGVLTVAVGFAARSSISNLISGIFLIFEKPFVVGDIIKVNQITGEVLSIDLISMSLRTLDNLMVRLPNDLVMSAPVVNYSHFPIRRMDIALQVPYEESLSSIHRILIEVAAKNDRALDEPGSLFQVESFTANYINITFSVWVARDQYWDAQAEFCKQIHRAFKASGVEQPHTSVRLIKSDVPATEAKP